MSVVVRDRLAALLISRFGVTGDELRPDVTFAELDLDSLAMVEFVMVVEKEFGVRIGEDDLTPQATMTDAISLIGEQVVRVE